MAKQQIFRAVASSSNSYSMESSKAYDVFLSFRGEDTRRNFTSHLYEALIQKKVETFRDSEELKKGNEISPSLIKAIKNSHVSVVIFSENYASSKWCLAELTKILECKKEQGQVVIPVFYNIDPSHVRKQTKSYKQAFAKHEQDTKCNKDELQIWKAALIEAANLAGWDSQTYRTEPEFIKDIVTDILQKLNLKYPTELKGLVGIKGNYAQLESLLEIGSREVRLIGIWGMGGIGKTTLATALYVKLYSQFEGHCFLASVRERSEKCGLDVLRVELFSKLLKEDHIDVPKIEPYFVIRRLSRKKVLVVLDDVATSEQLEDLIGNYKSLGEGSRVIVTTRDKHILMQADGFRIYKVMELNFKDSLQLFCLKAFSEKQPKNGYEKLSEGVVVYCNGNPLALRVLGADLHSRSKEVWVSKLRKLQKIQHVKIHNMLKLSFDDLDHTEKNIFLDIACFFKEWDRDRVTSILEACDFYATSGIEVLLDKALISGPHFMNNIKMHDLIQEMGQQIVDQESLKDPGRRSRLWRHEEVCDVLKHNRGTDAVEGITLDLSKLTEDLYLRSDSFSEMTKMRLLNIIHGNYLTNRTFMVYLPNGLDSLSDELRYLCWENFCLESLPSNFCAEHLVELHMRNSKLKKLWDGVQNLVNLNAVDLSNSKNLVAVPDLSRATNLEKVDLKHCYNLQVLPYKFDQLLSLTYLNLSRTNIEMLPADIKNLSKLKWLMLEDCKKLLSLPELPPSLEKLDASNCISLDTNSTQQMVVEHMLRRSIYHHFMDSYYDCFWFPGEHVLNNFQFHEGRSSITIPYLHKSDMRGFIYYYIFKGGIGDILVDDIYDTFFYCKESGNMFRCPGVFKDLISKHVLFFYEDISNMKKVNEAYDHCCNRTIDFYLVECMKGYNYAHRVVKGCGAIPVYASELGLDMLGGSSKNCF